MNVKIKRLRPEAVIPAYAHIGDSGFDLVAAEDVTIDPGQTVKVATGLAFQLPEGYELQIRPRSGITLETKLRVQFGTVDQGYIGEVSVTVDNIGERSTRFSKLYQEIHGDFRYMPLLLMSDGSRCEDYGAYKQENTYLIRKGDRIAQGIIAPVARAVFTEVDTLDQSDRGSAGFGSTGVTIKEGE